MYCVYGNSSWYIHGGPLFGGGPLLGGSVIGGSTVHYLDNFMFMGPPTSNACDKALATALQTCRELGVPVETQTEGPASLLTFLGIQIDTEATTLSLPEDKLIRILGLVLSWRSKKSVSKRELQSRIGNLNDAAMVVLPGRTFMRRMIDLVKIAHNPSHHVSLTANFNFK